MIVTPCSGDSQAAEPEATYSETALKVMLGSLVARRDEFDVTRAAIAAKVREQSADTSPMDPPRRSRAVLAFDGELQFLKAAFKLLVDDAESPFKGLGIEGFKISASASKYQQPCDAATCYRTLKTLNRSRKHVTRADYGGLLGVILDGIPKASRDTLSDFLERLPALLSSAFTRSSIIKGWEITGLYPVSPTTIMGGCGTWRKLSKTQADIILASIPSLTKEVEQLGEVTDASMQGEVGVHIDFVLWLEMHMKWPAGRAKPAEGRVFNQRRSIWLNHAAVTAARHDREQDKAARAAEKAMKAKKRVLAPKLSGLDKKPRTMPGLPKPRPAKAAKKIFKLRVKSPQKLASKAKIQSRSGRLVKLPKHLE